MIKKIYSVFVAAVFVFGMQSSVFAQTCTAVDAITSGTLTLTNQSKVCETTASLIFTYNKSKGTRQLVYGKTTSYGTNGPNLINGAKNADLTGLESGTKYYFKIEGIYSGSLKYTMTGSFSTNKSAVGVLKTYQTTPKTIVSIGKNIVAIPLSSDRTLCVQLFSVNGALVFKHDVNVANQVASIPSELFRGTGTYLCKITGATTSQKQVVTILN
jgi:hypothetical protein